MIRRVAIIGWLLVMSAACGKDAQPRPAAGEPGAGSATPRGSATTALGDAGADAAVHAPIVTPEAEPDTISHASEPAATTGAVVPTETFDGAAQRTRTRARLRADRSPVHLITGGTALELGERICADAMPTAAPATPILLKPNLGGFDWFRNPKTTGGDNGVAGRTTDPEFVRGVIRCLKARGHTQITVADGFTGKASDWDRLVAVSGYAKMAKDEGVPLVAMDDDGVFDVQGERPGLPVAITGMEKTTVPTLLMPRLLAWHLQHGLYVSLPKIKTHRYAVFSIGIKAQQGTVFYSNAAPAYRQRGRTHLEIGKALQQVKANAPTARKTYVRSLELFARRMADILEVEAPDVVLAEGAPAMSGDGFWQLYPSTEAVAIGGTNVVLVDRVGAQFLGLWNNAALGKELGGHTTSPLLTVAAKRLGIELTSPEVIGDGAALLATPRPYHLVGMANFVVRGPQVEVGPLIVKRIPAASAPRIDGEDDAAWAEASALTFDTDWNGVASGISTTVRALWHPATDATPAALFLRFELAGSGQNTDETKPIDVEQTELYKEDCVELFIAPDPARPTRYFEIEVGPHGHFYDLVIDRDAKPVRSDAGWSAGMTIGTTRDVATRRAVIEVAITAPELVAALALGVSLPIGLFRIEGKQPRRYLAAFPTFTPRPSFHVPSAFGRMRLE